MFPDMFKENVSIVTNNFVRQFLYNYIIRVI